MLEELGQEELEQIIRTGSIIKDAKKGDKPPINPNQVRGVLISAAKGLPVGYFRNLLSRMEENIGRILRGEGIETISVDRKSIGLIPVILESLAEKLYDSDYPHKIEAGITARAYLEALVKLTCI